MFDGVDFIAAHNAPFDRNVLRACCEAHGIEPPRQRFACTMKLARKVWGIYPTKLPDVCDELGIDLDHHEALSDAEACARIVIAALHDGHRI
jgi:DNA polymerase-3 subunit epsilon